MKLLLIACFALVSCQTKTPTEFSESALNDTFTTLEGQSMTFKEILKNQEGNEVVIDIWASWCKDCIAGMPDIKALQKQFPTANYLFLSLDRDIASWKRGIKKYDLKGDHFFVTSGWEGEFCSFLDLDWIPRYMVVDKKGTIKLYKAIEADDKDIKKALK